MSEAIEKRQIDDMIVQLRIVSNPHLKPDAAEKLAKELAQKRKRLYGFVDLEAKLDIEGFSAFKDQISKQSRSISVK